MAEPEARARGASYADFVDVLGSAARARPDLNGRYLINDSFLAL